MTTQITCPPARPANWGPREASADLAFADGAVSGTVRSMEAQEPKEVTVELVHGTIVDAALEYAIGCLPLDVATTYKFPVFDSESASLSSIEVTVMEVVDVETAAGAFKTYKVRIKRPDGESFVYVDQNSPHILVKQEVPSQALNIELKSLVN